MRPCYDIVKISQKILFTSIFNSISNWLGPARLMGILLDIWENVPCFQCLLLLHIYHKESLLAPIIFLVLTSLISFLFHLIVCLPDITIYLLAQVFWDLLIFLFFQCVFDCKLILKTNPISPVSVLRELLQISHLPT